MCWPINIFNFGPVSSWCIFSPCSSSSLSLTFAHCVSGRLFFLTVHSFWVTVFLPWTANRPHSDTKTVEKLLANFPFHALFNPESLFGWGTTLPKKFGDLYLSELSCFLGLREEQHLLHQVLLCWGNSWCFALEMLGKAWLCAHTAVWKSEVSN